MTDSNQNKIATINEIEQQIAIAKDPKVTFKIEGVSKAQQALAKEQRDYEKVIEWGRIYILAKRKTTELIEPEIYHGPHRWDDRDAPEGDSIPTIADYGFTDKQWRIRKKLLETIEDDVDNYIDYCKSEQQEPTTGGFISWKIEKTRQSINEHDEPEHDYMAELIEKWGVKYGQVWTIGNHRLICGDATSKEDMQRLMVGEIPQIIVNDPPYGMRLDADFSGMKSKLESIGTISQVSNFEGSKYNNVEGDWDDYNAKPIRDMWANVKEQFWFGADYYSATLGDTMHEGAWIVWDKRLNDSADKMYGSCFELIWSAKPHKRDMLRHKWAGIFGMDTDKRIHPNQKPVSLYSDILYRYSKPNATMLDCYVGSGTSLVACEYMGRIARGVELLPEFVAVTLERMSVNYPDLEINHEQ
jgi:DNA modification methylase